MHKNTQTLEAEQNFHVNMYRTANFAAICMPKIELNL